MSININALSDKERYFLLKLSYIDLPNKIDYSQPDQQRNIRDLLEKSIEASSSSEKKAGIKALLEEYDSLSAGGSKLGDIRIIGYENHNPVGNTTNDDKTGFVGYAFEDGDGNRGFLFRGSELKSEDVSSVDMNDNLKSAFTGTSTQVQQAKDFFDRFKAEGKTNSLYGHSKGNNLSAEVFLDNLDMDIYAYGVNGQPAYWYDLTEEQREALRGDRYTFIVHQFDVVNMLGYVDYIDKVVGLKDAGEILKDPFHPHSLDSVDFESDGSLKDLKDTNELGRGVINGIVTSLHVAERVTYFFGRGAEIVYKMSKDAYYYIVDTTKEVLRYAFEKGREMAEYVRDKCIYYLEKIEKLSREIADKLRDWYSDIIDKAGLFFNELMDRIRGIQIAVEPYLHVNTSRLMYYARRLEAIGRQVSEINSRLDSLYYRTDLLDLDNLFKADMLTQSNNKLNHLIKYLYNSAELLENAENRLLRQARLMR